MEQEIISKKQTAAMAFAIGVMICLITSMFIPKEKEIKEVIKYRERVRTVKKIVERPDGTKETTETTDTARSFDQDKSLKVTNRPDWNIGVASSLNSSIPVYSLIVQRRILGNLHMGVYGQTDSTIGALISYSF